MNLVQQNVQKNYQSNNLQKDGFSFEKPKFVLQDALGSTKSQEFKNIFFD